jgi:hypothetical protein
MASTANEQRRAKEQPMFPIAHPDLMGQLAIERSEGLRAAAARFRLGRPTLLRWSPARFVDATPDLSRVTPDPVAFPRTDRAA